MIYLHVHLHVKQKSPVRTAAVGKVKRGSGIVLEHVGKSTGGDVGNALCRVDAGPVSAEKNSDWYSTLEYEMLPITLLLWRAWAA